MHRTRLLRSRRMTEKVLQIDGGFGGGFGGGGYGAVGKIGGGNSGKQSVEALLLRGNDTAGDDGLAILVVLRRPVVVHLSARREHYSTSYASGSNTFY